jgi:TPR repeat protein
MKRRWMRRAGSSASKRVAFFLMTCLTLAAQQPAPAPAQHREPPPPRSADERDLQDGSGRSIIRYLVEAPPKIAPAGAADPAQQVGLFLCFPEHGRPTGDDLFPVREALRRQGLSDQYVLLAAHAQDPYGKMGAADHEPIQKLIAWAERTYPINPRRIYAFGKGEGGEITGEFAVMHPELLAAGITYSWGWWTLPSELNEPIDFEKSAPEFYMVLGLRDLAHHLTTVRDTYERIKAKGYHIIYREFAELGERSYHPVSNDDAIAWATRLRNKNVPLSAQENELLKAFHRNPPAPTHGYYPTLALVGGAPAGEVVQKLLESPDESVRAAAAATCQYAIFDERTSAALGRLLSDPSAKVRRNAINALALYANWRSEAAQQALIQAALDPERRLEDRIDAADAIRQAVALQAAGARQDLPLFRALVALLQEHAEPLRAVAHLALAPVRDPDYKPGGAPERKAPSGGWDLWLEQIAAKEAGDLADYRVCGWSETGTGAPYPGNRGMKEPVDLFCLGGYSLLGKNLATGQPVPKNPALAFQYTLSAAEQGYVPAEEAVGMMYANGQGVRQNYAEAGKWWIKAAEGGNLRAANHAAMLYRNGEGVPRDRTISEKWARYVEEHTALPK